MLARKIRLPLKYLGMVVILLTAIITRFYQFIPRMMFLGDQGRDVLRAYEILHGNLTFIGPMTSVGNFYLGPFYYYFIVPWLWLFRYSPVGPAVGIAVFSLLTIALLYYFIYKITSSHLDAFVFSMIFATNPIVVEYSRFSWNPNLLPFMSLLFVMIVYFIKPITKKDKVNFWYPFFLGSVYGLILQLHYLAGLIIFLPLILDRKFWFNLKKSYLAWFVLILSTVEVELPFLLFEARHHFRELHNLINTFHQSSASLISFQPVFLLKSSLRVIKELNNRFLYGYPLFLLAAVYKYFKQPDRLGKFIVIFNFIAILSLAVYKGPLYDHYFAFVYFLPVLTLFFYWSKIKETKLRWSLLLIYSLLIVAANLLTTYKRIFRNPPNYQLATTRQVSQLIIAESHGRPFNLALLSDNNYSDGYKFFLIKEKAPLKTIHQKLTDQLFVVCEKTSDECKPLNNPLWDIAAFGWAKEAGVYKVRNVTVFKLIHTQNS